MDISFSNPMVMLGVLVVILIVLVMLLKVAKVSPSSEGQKTCSKGGGCCGGSNCHTKKTEGPRIVYFDDHELDRFRDRMPDSYSESEVAEFVEVYETLLTEDKDGWLDSLKHRSIVLPDALALRIASEKQSHL
ncbi:hypothetical protein [Porphyromonas sp.]|uniref:hypothetical protein n=1 Tax=Porphyromonas sp. TaxID=1924944 RepID=UPI0026DC1DC4|nr:hypothetical protein [Porphyromonas sp.]MDO4771634.1 hypothetical protein [Porphyromonas sp.]